MPAHVWKHPSSVSDNVQFPLHVIKGPVRGSGWCCDNWMQSWVTDQFHFIWKDLCVLSPPEYKTLNTLIGCCIVITFSYFNSIFLVPRISALFRWGSVYSAQCLWSGPCCHTDGSGYKIGASHFLGGLALIKSPVSVFLSRKRSWSQRLGVWFIRHYVKWGMFPVSCSKQTVFHIKLFNWRQNNTTPVETV